MQEVVRVQMFFTALPLAFGLLHLLLYAALPRLRSNLFYALFLLFIAAAIFLDFQGQFAQSRDQAMVLARLHRGFLALSFVFGLRFFYEVFLSRAPAQFRYLAAGLLVAGSVAVVSPIDWFWPFEILLVVVLVEALRAMIGAVRRRQEDAWLLGGGFIVFIAFSSYDMLMDFGLIRVFRGVDNAYQFGLVGLFVATSAYLARSVARTTNQLVAHEKRVQQQEIERQLLEAEVERTKAELEQARALQLSMLPANLPERPGLQFAVHMKTAVEVGGDYYDFRDADGDTLTVAVGDATGHGLRAGMMVAITKSLFQGLSDHESLPDFFRRCTRVLKSMRLGNLFMALALVRVRRDGLTVSLAGMPPLLIFRAESGDVEEVSLKGMPLGAFPEFEYEHTWIAFRARDTLLLMTDGLMEQFNEEREMLGLERVKEAFRAVAHREPDEIVVRLRTLGEEWQGSQVQGDDVTLLVLKARERVDAR